MKWWTIFLSTLLMGPAAFAQTAPKASPGKALDVVVWVCKDTNKEGTEKITIPFKAPNGKRYEVKCDVEMKKGTKKNSKAGKIAAAVTSASQQHQQGDAIAAVASNGKVMLTANCGFKMYNPELTNNTGEKSNKEIKGAPSASCESSICAIGFSGNIVGYDGYGEESEITVGWNSYSCTAHLDQWSELEPWIEDVEKYANSLGYQARHGYDQYGTLWLLVEIPPIAGSYTMRFGSTDLSLSQKALSWYGALDPLAQAVNIKYYDYVVILK